MSFCHEVRSQRQVPTGGRARGQSPVYSSGALRLWELEVGSLLAPDISRILIKIVQASRRIELLFVVCPCDLTPLIFAHFRPSRGHREE